MDAIALGSLTALFVSHIRLERRARWVFVIVGSAAMLFVLLLSQEAPAMVLKALGLDMTLLAVGTCMLITVAVQTQWRSPVTLTPLRWMGQRSYEIYLSHMFVVVMLFRVYLRWGKPLAWVPVVFLAVIAGAGILGALVARFYTEPLNQLLRRTIRWDVG
jgi:peptidoglycan/LPS O-acetylase OafA/YrhL